MKEDEIFMVIFRLEQMKNRLKNNSGSNSNTVEAPVNGHPWEAEKVSATGAGHLRE